MNKATFIFLIVAFFLCISCKEKVNSQSKAVNKNYRVNKVDIRYEVIDTLLGQDFYFSEILYKSQLVDNQLLLADSRFCNIIKYDLQTKKHQKYASENYPKINQCLHSMTISGDTTILFFTHGITAVKILADTVYQIQKFSSGDTEVHANHNVPIKILSNQSYLVPTGSNILKSLSYTEENLDINDPVQFMQDQYLFALYNKKGNLIKKFGKFPAIYQISNLKTSSFQDYYYSVSKNRIFVAFAMAPIVQVYDLSGNLLEEIKFNLAEFEVISSSTTKNKWLNSIDGFAVENLGDNQYNYYFKTLNTQKKKYFLYKVDTQEQVTYESPVLLPTGMMMSTVEKGGWLYISMSWDDKPIVIKKFLFQE